MRVYRCVAPFSLPVEQASRHRKITVQNVGTVPVELPNEPTELKHVLLLRNRTNIICALAPEIAMRSDSTHIQWLHGNLKLEPPF